MSYRCDNCRQVIGPGILQRKVVTKVREKTHEYGTEIVAEAIVCPNCEFDIFVETTNKE